MNRSLDTAKLPHFIIAGAMKCGTTSIHHILAQHDRVFIPRKELFFFTIDDVEQHPDFFVPLDGDWTDYDYDHHFDEYLAWYRAFFADARDNQIIGEDSPVTLASAKAAARIAALLPDVKLIVMLRDPVARAYSHYWHLMAAGRALFNFERTIQFNPGTILQRGFYRRQIERLLQHIPAAQCRFIMFERFVQQTQEVTDELCQFIGLDDRIDVSRIDTSRNPAETPRSVRLQIFYNRLFRTAGARRYVNGMLPGASQSPGSGIGRWLDKRFRKLNLVEKPYPPMHPKTRLFLQQLYARENRGLSDLVGADVRHYWNYMDA